MFHAVVPLSAGTEMFQSYEAFALALTVPDEYQLMGVMVVPPPITLEEFHCEIYIWTLLVVPQLVNV